MRSRLSRLWVAVAILPLIAGFAFASTPGLFVCRGDGVARLECCCPTAAHGVSAVPTTHAALEGACCCDRSQLEAPPPVRPAVPTVTTPVTPDLALALVTTVDLGAIIPDGLLWRANRFGHSPPRAVPILLGKQSFLI